MEQQPLGRTMTFLFDVTYIPSKKANNIQILYTADGMKSLGYHVMVLGDLGLKNIFSCFRNIHDYYDIKHPLIIKRIWRWPLTIQRRPRYSVMKAKRIAHANPEVVVTRNVYLVKALLERNIHVIWEVHQPPETQAEYNLVNEVIVHDRLLFVSTISHELRIYLAEKIGIDTGRIVVFPDAARDCFLLDGGYGRSERYLRGDVNKKDIGYIGHLYKGKGMEIIERVARSAPQYNFHIIGGEEQDITFWKRRCSDIGNIYFYGYMKQSDLPKYRSQMDVFLLPNQPEVVLKDGRDIGGFTSPLKMFEYMSTGKPIVASNLKVLKEVLTHNESAILVSHSDEKEWIDAIDRLLTNDALRERISSHARAEYVNKYSYQIRARNMMAAIDTVLN